MIKAHSSSVRSICFTSDERFLLTGSDDKTLKLFDLHDKRRFRCSLSGHSNWVRTAAISPTNEFCASGGDDKTVKLWR